MNNFNSFEKNVEVKNDPILIDQNIFKNIKTPVSSGKI